ncbi:MAG: segregation and condensation protein A [Actinomycetota bacterium]
MGERTLAPSGEFPVELPIFRGPFRLLAELILDQRVDVCDVPVSQVTEQFLARAGESEGWTLEEATWFIAICALLLELKVGRLLPRDRRVEEDDLLGVSPDLVYARRLELAAFRRVAVVLTRRFEEAGRFFPRETGPAPEFAQLYPDLLAGVVPEDIAEAAVGLLRPARIDLSHVTPIRATVADGVAALVGRLEKRPSSRFRDLVADCEDRIQVVVRFLALLELYREGRVALHQAETFGEIEVEWAS